MTTFIATLIVMLFIVAAMSVGVIFSKKPIKGSCGGLAQLGMQSECDICGGKDAANIDKEKAKSLTYNAARPHHSKD